MLSTLNIAIALLALFGAIPEAYRGFKWVKAKLSDRIKAVKS